MSDEDFYFKASDLINLRKFCKNAPRQFNHAAAGVLNEQAFGNRRESLQIIESQMIVRNPSFVRSSMRVEKARGAMPIDQQRSIFGSVNKNRSTGFVEQETGEQDNRTRVGTLFSRGGSQSSQIKPGMRMKQGRNMVGVDDEPIKANNESHRTVIFLQMMARKKPSKPFKISKRYKGLKRGIYQFKGGKLKTLFDTDHKPRAPKRVKWLSGGERNHRRSVDMRSVWAREVDKQLKFIKK